MTPAEISYSYLRSKAIEKIKILLGIVVIFLLLIIIVWPMTNPVGRALKLTFTSIKKATFESAMINPSFHGIDKDNNPYNVTAEEAQQIDNDTVRLKKISGDITVNDGKWIFIKADSGTIKLSTKMITLGESVNIMSDSGYEFTTTSAQIDLKQSIAYGNEPVVLHGLPGVLNAKGFEVVDKGNKFIFHGPVELVIYENNKKAE